MASNVAGSRRLTAPTTTPAGKSLLARLVRRGIAGLLALAVLLFVPAGSLKFWQGWAFIAANLAGSLALCIYFYKHDPQLLERRMLLKEKLSAQKSIMRLGKFLYFLVLLLPGLDFRLGWTTHLTGPLPLWLMLLALASILAGNVLFFRVMKTNRFAASIIQVEAGQPVISTGPYRYVRHPMYSGIFLTWLAAPLLLGSIVALPAFALLMPIIIFRLLHEEKFLRRELPGYAEYCQRTRWRLVPFVW